MTLKRIGQAGSVAGLAWMLWACSSGPLDGPLTTFAIHDLEQVTAPELEVLKRAQPGASPERQAVEATLPEAPTADDYVQAALSRNLAIVAAEQRVLRTRERIAQATSLDDPMISIAPFGDMAETAAGSVAVMTSLSQRLPYPGKLDVRGRIVAQDVAIAEQELERVRLGVIADTRRAYWNLYYSARAIEVTERNRNLLNRVREVVSAKLRTGATSQESALRISVELNNLANELITLQQNRITAAAMLNALIDQPVETPLPDPQPVQLSHVDMNLERLLAAAESSSPEIQLVREQIGRFREQRKQARLNRFPDLTVGVTYNFVNDNGLSMAANGQDQWWFSFGANLPIWTGRLDAAQREATRGLVETAAMLGSERNRIAFKVQDALTRVQTQQRQAVLLRDVIVPEAEHTVEASLSGYRAGAVGFLNLIDNWRKLLNFQLMYESSLASLERSVAELEQVVGRDVQREATGAEVKP